MYGDDNFKIITINPTNSNKDIKEKIEKIQKEELKPVIFTPLINSNINTSAKNHTCYFNPTLDLCIWKIK